MQFNVLPLLHLVEKKHLEEEKPGCLGTWKRWAQAPSVSAWESLPVSHVPGRGAFPSEHPQKLLVLLPEQSEQV